jgi:hypothetical protein
MAFSVPIDALAAGKRSQGDWQACELLKITADKDAFQFEESFILKRSQFARGYAKLFIQARVFTVVCDVLPFRRPPAGQLRPLAVAAAAFHEPSALRTISRHFSLKTPLRLGPLQRATTADERVLDC